MVARHASLLAVAALATAVSAAVAGGPGDPVSDPSGTARLDALAFDPLSGRGVVGITFTPSEGHRVLLPGLDVAVPLSIQPVGSPGVRWGGFGLPGGDFVEVPLTVRIPFRWTGDAPLRVKVSWQGLGDDVAHAPVGGLLALGREGVAAAWAEREGQALLLEASHDMPLPIVTHDDVEAASRQDEGWISVPAPALPPALPPDAGVRTSDADAPWIEVADVTALRVEVERARRAGRPVFVEVWAGWCRYCKSYAQVLQQPEVREARRGFVWLRVNVTSDRREAVRVAAGLRPGQPALAFLDEKGRVRRALAVERWHQEASASVLMERFLYVRAVR